MLEYHIAKKADITVVCKDLEAGEDATRFGTVRMNESARIEEFEEKPMVAHSHTISTGIYVIRRRQLIDLIEHCAEEERHDFVTDILIRYKNLKLSLIHIWRMTVLYKGRPECPETDWLI